VPKGRELVVSLRCQVVVVRTIASSSIMTPLRTRTTPNDALTYCGNFSVFFHSQAQNTCFTKPKCTGLRAWMRLAAWTTPMTFITTLYYVLRGVSDDQ